MTLRTVLLSLQALLAAAEPDDPQDAVVANQVRYSVDGEFVTLPWPLLVHIRSQTLGEIKILNNLLENYFAVSVSYYGGFVLFTLWIPE